MKRKYAITNIYQDRKNKVHLEDKHYALRQLLDDNKHRWMLAKEIQENLCLPWYPCEGTFHGSTAERQIVADVKLINKSDVFDKKIISSRGKGYKLGTKAQCLAYARAEKKELKKRWKQLHEFIKDCNLDGQMRLPLEPHGRKVYQKFVDQPSSHQEQINN